MSKHRLILHDDYEFLCFGISCHLKDYRVAWHLNNLYNFNFVRDQIQVSDREGVEHEYSVFKFRDAKSHLNYLLVSNFSENMPLIKAYKQFNTFLLVEGYIDIFDPEVFISKLKTLEAIQLVTPIDKTPLEKYQYSLFED